jgi:hypothetical protein
MLMLLMLAVSQLSDQQTTLKSGALTALCILAAVTYSLDKQSWVEETGILSADLLAKVSVY